MSIPFIDAGSLHELLPYEAAIDALEGVFATDPLPDAPQRIVMSREDGQLFVMPSWGDAGAGVKLVTLNERNPARGLPLIGGVYVLFSPETLEAVALIDAAALTAIRTASVSALATRHLAPADAPRLVIFGAGVQAEAHALALSRVRRLTDVAIVSPRAQRVEALADRLAGAGLPARSGTETDVAAADLVCTCTTSSTPVFDGGLLRPGSHVNGIGSHRPDARELDASAIEGARVYVETVAAAMAEAGDLLIPIREGRLQQSELVELSAALRDGRPPGPTRTVFKSVGVAFEDLAVAAAAFRRL